MVAAERSVRSISLHSRPAIERSKWLGRAYYTGTARSAVILWAARAAVALTAVAGILAFLTLWAPTGESQRAVADGFMKVFSHGAFSVVAFALGRASAHPTRGDGD